MMDKSGFPHQVFRAYDIRGLADQEITPDFARSLAQAYVGFVDISRPVVVGRDARLTSPALQQALVQGLTDAGADVWDLGMVPTPMAYYAVHRHDAAGCIMVTASHNPTPYNGFKLMRGKFSFHGEALQALKGSMLANKPMLRASGQGKVSRLDVLPDYQAFVARDCVLARPLKVVIDAGNGPTGLVAQPVYRRMGCEVVAMYCEPDGNFPHHHPDPTVEANLEDLKAKVLETEADLGIAFDGDGDRIGVVDERGRVIWGDMLLLLLARDVLRRHPGATIISEAKSSQLLYDEVRARGGKALMGQTGHALMKAMMRQTGALLAGEMSGHFFFADRYHGFDDAVYAGARLMQVLAAGRLPLSALLADLPRKISTPEIRLDCPDDKKFAIVEAARQYFTDAGYTMNTTDGIRLMSENGWALLRASNTQPALVLRYEADDEAGLQQWRDILEAWLMPRLGGGNG